MRPIGVTKDAILSVHTELIKLVVHVLPKEMTKHLVKKSDPIDLVADLTVSDITMTTPTVTLATIPVIDNNDVTKIPTTLSMAEVTPREESSWHGDDIEMARFIHSDDEGMANA